MNKTDWDKMDTFEKDELVWAAFPAIPPESEQWSLSTDGGESCFLSYATEIQAKRALLAVEERVVSKTDSRYGAKIFLSRYPLHFHSARDACALVLDEIEKRFLVADFENEFTNESGRASAGDLWAGLRADLDMICYCAVKTGEA